MHIVGLHELARQELREMFTQRYMPRGWHRDGDRKVTRAVIAHEKDLTEALAQVTDRLMPRPARTVLLGVHRAAQTPKLVDSVHKMVKLLAALPEVDQEEAFGVAQVTMYLRTLDRVDDKVTTAAQALREQREAAKSAGLDVGPALDALVELGRVIEDRRRVLEHVRPELEIAVDVSAALATRPS